MEDDDDVIEGLKHMFESQEIPKHCFEFISEYEEEGETEDDVICVDNILIFSKN
jgi:hypothetical protein